MNINASKFGYLLQKSQLFSNCPICNSNTNIIIKTNHKQDYYYCNDCNFIYINNVILQKIDNGEQVFAYESDYWKNELESAKDRSYGSAIARMSECIHYCKIPIQSFLDIGTGPGYFLDAVAYHLPNKINTFYGWELFPPSEEYRTKQINNYYNCSLKEIPLKFQAGMCIEVIEHLTPSQVKNLMQDLICKIDKGAFFIFNTGLVEFVLNEDINYIDPILRGHISIWSVAALNKLLNPLGYVCHKIGQKTWAVGIEFVAKPVKDLKHINENIVDRIWSILPENKNILCDEKSGSVCFILGRESARAYD